MFKRLAVFLYSTFSYVVILATFLHTIGFIGNVFVRRSIDAPRTSSLATGLAIDIALLLGFAIQRSVMARPAFKRWMTRFIPEPADDYREYRQRLTSSNLSKRSLSGSGMSLQAAERNGR